MSTVLHITRRPRSIGIRDKFRSARHTPQSRRSYKDLNWQWMIDHIAAEIWIVTVWLGALVCSRRTRQQRLAAWVCRSHPILLPASPCVPAYRVEDCALNPRPAAIEADPDLGDIGVPRPSGTEDGVGAAGFEPLVHAGACNL